MLNILRRLQNGRGVILDWLFPQHLGHASTFAGNGLGKPIPPHITKRSQDILKNSQSEKNYFSRLLFFINATMIPTTPDVPIMLPVI